MKSSGQQQRYREGDWALFALGGRTVAVRVARGRRGVCFGYFYVFDTEPALAELEQLTPSGATLCTKFGDLGLAEGRWRLMPSADWKPALWGIPPLVRHDELDDIYLVTEYDDGLIARKEYVVPRSRAADLWEDVLETEVTIKHRLEQMVARRPPATLTHAAAPFPSS